MYDCTLSLPAAKENYCTTLESDAREVPLFQASRILFTHFR